MGSKDLSLRAGHRTRLRDKFLQTKLVDYELFELLLTYAIPRIDVRPLSRELLKKYGGVYQILTATVQSLQENKGVGENTAIFIKSIYEIMLSGYKDYLDTTPIFRDYEKLTEYCKLLLGGKETEEFHILYLDTNYRLLSDDLHSSGTIDWAAVYKREVVKRALTLNASSIIMVHNHPGAGDCFSSDDIEITTVIKNILEPVGVILFDHLLVSGSLIYSARNMFLIK